MLNEVNIDFRIPGLLSIPEYVIKKGGLHGHKYGKAPESKEYHLVHNLKKRCIKRKFTGIHDRFLRILIFRESMLEHEDVCLKWDDLAEQDFTYRNDRSRIFFGGSLSISPETKDH